MHVALTPVINDVDKILNKIRKFSVKKLKNINLSPLKLTVKTIKNTVKDISQIIKPIKDAFNEIFPQRTTEKILKISIFLEKLTRNFKMTSEQSENLKNTFKGVFAILDIGKQIFSGFLPILIRFFKNLSNGFLSASGIIGDFISKIDEALKTSNLITSISDALLSFYDTILNNINFKNISNLFSSALTYISNIVTSIMSLLSNAVIKISNIFNNHDKNTKQNGLVKVFTDIYNIVKDISSDILNTVGHTISKILEYFSNGDISGIINIITSLLLGKITLNISEFTKSFSKNFDEIKGLTGNITGILKPVQNTLQSYQENLKANTLLKIASAIAILAASIALIASIEPERLDKALASILVLFGGLMTAFKSFEKISSKSDKILNANTTMITMSTSVLILASAMKKLSGLSWEDIGKSITGIGAMSAILIATVSILSKNRNSMKSIKGITTFAIALKVLANVCKDLSSLSWEELAKGLTGITTLLAAISIFLNTAKFGAKSTTTALGILILSGALKILANVCGDFGHMKWEDIGKGLSSIGVLLAEISLFTNLTGNSKKIMRVGLTLLSVTVMIKTLCDTMLKLGNMSWESIAKGLATLAGALATITITMNLMTGSLTSATSLIIIAEALGVLSGVLKNIANMSWESIAKGLATLAGALISISIAMNLMKGCVSSASALLIVSMALLSLNAVLKSMGNMSWESIVKGLIALAGVFTVIGLAAKLLNPVIPAILGLSASLALLGVGLTGIGIGLLAAAIGITTFSGSIAVLVASLKNILKSLATIIPEIVSALVGGLVKGIATVIPEISESIKTILLEILSLIKDVAPSLIETALVVISALLSGLSKHAATITNDLADFIIGVLQALTKKIPKIVEAGIGVVKAIFEAIFKAVGFKDNSITKMVLSVGALAGMFALLAAMKKYVKNALITGAAMTTVLLMITGAFAIMALIPLNIVSIADKLSNILLSISATTVILSEFSGSAAGALKGIEGLGVVLAGLTGILVVAGALNQIPGFSWLIGEGTEVLGQIGYAIGNFVGNIIGGFSAGASSGLPEIGNNLSKFMTNAKTFIDGAKSIDKSAATGIKALCSAVLELTATKFLDGIANFLGIDTSFEDFGDKISSFGPALKKFQESTADLDTKSVEKSAKATEALVKVANELPKTKGLLGWIKGQDDLGSFGDKLSTFGKGIGKYAKSVSGIKDFSPITKSAKAAEKVVDLASKLPNTEDFWGWASGKDDIGSFGNKLSAFGKGIRSFIDSVKDIKDFSPISKSASAATSIVELADKLPNTEDFWGWASGKDDIGSFGDKMGAFGEGIRSFIDSVKGIKDFSVMEKAKNSSMRLVELGQYLSENGNMDITNVGSFIGEINQNVVPRLKDFNNSTKDIDANKANTISEFMVHMMTVAQNAMSISTKGLKTFASELPNIGSNLATYYSNIKKISAIKLVAVASALTALSNTSKTISGSDTNGIKDFISSFEHIGTDGITKFIGSLGKSSGKAKYAITKLFKNLCSTVDSLKISLHSKMNAAGSYAVDGFAKGIKANDYKAAASAKVMAEKAEKAAKKALDEHSPSKVFQEIGAFTVLGYVKGVDKNRDKAINATYKMCKKIVSFSKRIFKATTNEMITGSGVFKTLTDSFFGEFKKNLKPKEIAKVYKSASKAVSDYAFQLYKESGQYKEDNKTANKHRKELQKLYAEREKLRSKKVISDKKSKKASEEAAQAESKASKVSSKKHKQEAKEAKKNAQTTKKSATAAKKQSENLKKSLKENAKNIKAKKKELIKDQKDVAKNIASTLKEIKTDIADSVKDFTDPFKASLDTGIELFEKFDKGTRMSTSRILRYMKSQVEGVSNWRENLEELSSKGFSAGFIDMYFTIQAA